MTSDKPSVELRCAITFLSPRPAITGSFDVCVIGGAPVGEWLPLEDRAIAQPPTKPSRIPAIAPYTATGAATTRRALDVDRAPSPSLTPNNAAANAPALGKR